MYSHLTQGFAPPVACNKKTPPDLRCGHNNQHENKFYKKQKYIFYFSNKQIIAVALHGAGVDHRIDYNAMVKGHLAAVLEFTQWLNKYASDPYFSDRIRNYDAGQRRAFCKQSIRSRTTGDIGRRERTRSISRRRGRRKRRTSTGGPRTTLGVVQGGGGEDTGTAVSDCNSRCRTAIKEEESVLYTTEGHGLPYRRTLRARKVPSPGSSGVGGDGTRCSGDAETTRRRRPTVPLRTCEPGNKGLHYSEDMRCAWPDGLLSSGAKVGHPPSGQPRRPARGITHREEKGRCKEKNGVAVWNNQGKSDKDSPPPPFESVVWDRELVVLHPRVPAGCELRVELIPGPVGGARRLESLFRETAESGGDSNDQPAVVLGSMRGIRNGGSSVLKFFLADSIDVVGGGGSSGPRRSHDSWSPLDGKILAKKPPVQPFRGGKEEGHGHGVEEHPCRARDGGNTTGARARRKALAATETLDYHNEGSLGKSAKNGDEGWRGRGEIQGNAGNNVKRSSLLTAAEIRGRMKPSPPLLPRRRRRFGAEGAGSALLLARAESSIVAYPPARASQLS